MSVDQKAAQDKPKIIPWLRLARMGWYPVAALTLVILIASIPGLILIGFSGVTDLRFSPNPSPLSFLFSWLKAAGLLATGLISLFLAVLLFHRKPEDRMALLTSFFLLLFGVGVLGSSETMKPFFPGAANIIQHVFPPGWNFPLFLLLFAFFPDGQIKPRWMRWILLLAIIAFPIFLFWANPPYFKSPIDFSEQAVLITIGMGLVLSMIIMLSFLYAQIYRYRYLSTQEQKQQTKVVLYGMGVWSTLQVVLAVPWIYTYTLPAGEPIPLWYMAASIPYLISLTILPVTLTVAVMRYRLFQIDFLINRSLVYGGLTAIIILIYIVVVGALGAFFQTQGNLIIALLATGLVAVLFQPLRERLQSAVNRLIYGERDDPIETLSRLGKRLESALAPDKVLPILVETTAQTLKLPFVAIRLFGENGERLAASYGQQWSNPIKLPLTYQGEAIGQLVVAPRNPGESFEPSEMRLLQTVARQAGSAVHAVRLTVDLQRSRQRLVTAREEERRRLRRDLHDGLGPTLAALHIQVTALRRLIHNDPETAEMMVAEFDEEIREAIDDIRQVVYELRPPTLDELGLVGAARVYADHCSRQIPQQTDQGSEHNLEGQDLSIQLVAPKELPTLPAAVEVAAYHVIREALTNVVHHAHAEECFVRLRVEKALIVEIEDDGIGIPEGHQVGVGLLSMRERTEELGGRFVIEPGREGGTCVRAQFPLLGA